MADSSVQYSCYNNLSSQDSCVTQSSGQVTPSIRGLAYDRYLHTTARAVMWDGRHVPRLHSILTNSFEECSKSKMITPKCWHFIGPRLPLGAVDRRTLAHGVARVLLALARCSLAGLPCGLRYLPCAHCPETCPAPVTVLLLRRSHGIALLFPRTAAVGGAAPVLLDLLLLQ